MVSATGNIRKEKSRNLSYLTNFLRIKKGLKKKAFEFSTLVGVDACSRDHECGGVSSTSTGVVVGVLKKKRYIRDLIQNHPAGGIGVTSSSSSCEQDDDAWSLVQERALIQALKELIPKGKDVIITNQRCWEQVATTVPGKKTGHQCKKKFALLMKGGFSFDSVTEEEEELKNEFMGLYLQ